MFGALRSGAERDRLLRAVDRNLELPDGLMRDAATNPARLLLIAFQALNDQEQEEALGRISEARLRREAGEPKSPR